MPKINTGLLILLIGRLLSINTAGGQEATVIPDSLFSQVLNEQRNIKILLPGSYTPGSDNKYDVVYLIDGENHFEDFSFISRFAGNEKLIPPLLLVAIPNTFTAEGSMRDRDLLPEKTPENARAGGADNFIAFLRDELIPYIENKYSPGGDKSLFGHSMGGLFTFYVLLKEPGLFSNFYCSDPSFPWKNRRIIAMAEDSLKNCEGLYRTLWINGVEDTYKNVGIQRMDSVLKEFSPGDLRSKVSVYPHETHMSVRLKGIYDGLKYVYEGYNSRKMTEFHPNNGSIVEGKPAAAFLNGSFPDVYYTTDGTEPDTSSARAPQMIPINGPSELRVKWIGENRKYITTAQGRFEASGVWPAIKEVKGIRAGGLRYSYFEGSWDSLPDFNRLKAVRTGVADSSFNLQMLPSAENFGCIFEGYLKINKDGYYAFALSSSDGSKLYINGREIINNDGLHGNDWYRSYLVPMQTGFYPVRLEYFEKTGSRQIGLIYISPDTFETVNLTFKMMFYK